MTEPPYPHSPDAVYVYLFTPGMAKPALVAAARDPYRMPRLLRHLADSWSQRFPDLMLHADDCGCSVCGDPDREHEVTTAP